MKAIEIFTSPSLGAKTPYQIAELFLEARGTDSAEVPPPASHCRAVPREGAIQTRGNGMSWNQDSSFRETGSISASASGPELPTAGLSCLGGTTVGGNKGFSIGQSGPGSAAVGGTPNYCWLTSMKNHFSHYVPTLGHLGDPPHITKPHGPAIRSSPYVVHCPFHCREKGNFASHTWTLEASSGKLLLTSDQTLLRVLWVLFQLGLDFFQLDGRLCPSLPYPALARILQSQYSQHPPPSIST